MASKPEILAEISQSYPSLAHEVAEKYSGILLDLSCQTPNCNKKQLKVWVQKPISDRGTLNDEIRYITCPNCGIRGNYQFKVSEVPTQDEIDKARLEEKARNIHELETDIAILNSKIENLNTEIAGKKSQIDALSQPAA
jgi:hypothetical protein